MNNNLKPSEKICSPFMYYCQKVIPLAFDESMSYYEQLCNLVYYLKNTVMPAVNNNADALTEVQNAYKQLEKYVDDYFKNLDVQTEINNKLDEMAVSGQLTEIVAQYLQISGILAYNTINDMKESKNLVNGSFAKTYGENSLLDGKGRFYKIRTIQNNDVVDNVNIIALNNPNLIAELIPEKYLQDILSYDTINDMKKSTNLINGNFVKTNGFYEYNDGGSAYYKIRTITNEDVIDNIHLFAIVNDNTLVAELYNKDVINIKQLGARNDIDNTTIINYALDNYKRVIIPDDTFNISDSLVLKDNTILEGINKNSIINLNHEYTMPLILCENKNNVTVKDITLKNDVSHTGSGVPNNLIGNFYNVNNILIDNVNVPIIYSQGINFKKCGNIKITNSNFSNAGHSMVVFLTETHDILIDNCVFDTITGTGNNDYLLATGSKDYETIVNYLVKNMTVQNSKFMNNPNWEGLESHGCSGFYAYNNYIYNCYDGIHVYFDDRTPTVDHERKDVIIKNNTIINPNKNMKYGIIVGGTANYFLNNIIIDNNIISGVGSASGNNGIYVLYANYFDITNNNISNFGIQGINTAYCNIGKINNNFLHTVTTIGAGGINIAKNSWAIEIDDNIVNGNGLIARAITGSAYKGFAMLGNNICLGYTDFKYYFGSPNKTLIGSTNINNTRRIGCKGIYSRNDDGLIYMHCTDDVIRSISEITNAKATATTNTNIVNTTGDAIDNFCIGQEIVISGAGQNGEDLTTIVTDFIGINQIKISTPILTSVSNANISTTASTWVSDV